MTTVELLRMEAIEANRKRSLPDLIAHCESIAARGATLREALNAEERVAFDAFATLANAARHVLTLQHV